MVCLIQRSHRGSMTWGEGKFVTCDLISNH